MKQARKTKSLSNSQRLPLSSATDKALFALSSSVGDFIRYWGFRRVHGEIWTQVYLSAVPLSGAELTKKLKVSKALVSPAIAELLAYELLLPAGGDGKTKRYMANPEVFAVIRKVLQQREKKLLEKAAFNYSELQKIAAKSSDNSALDRKSMEIIGQMISGAQVVLEFVLTTANDADFQSWKDLAL